MPPELWAWLVRHTPRDERGQDLVEYAVIIALIAIVVIGVAALLGNNLSLTLGAIASEVGP